MISFIRIISINSNASHEKGGDNYGLACFLYSASQKLWKGRQISGEVGALHFLQLFRKLITYDVMSMYEFLKFSLTTKFKI